MKEIILMQLPLSLKSTSSVSILTLLLTAFSCSSSANDSDIALRTGFGLYNGVDGNGLVSEELSSNFVVGTQIPIKGGWSASLDGFSLKKCS